MVSSTKLSTSASVNSGPKRLLSAIFFLELKKCFQLALSLTRSLTILGAAEIVSNYSPKWRWVALATDTEVNSFFSIQHKYTLQKVNLDVFFTCHGCKSVRHFFPSCSEVNSTGYSEFDEPIRARVQRYPLF